MVFKFIKNLFAANSEISRKAGYEYAAGNILKLAILRDSLDAAIHEVEGDFFGSDDAFNKGGLQAVLDFEKLRRIILRRATDKKCCHLCGGPLVHLSTVTPPGCKELGAKYCSRCHTVHGWPLSKGQKSLVSSNRGDRRK